MERLKIQTLNFRGFLKLVIPSVVMMVFMSLYTIVDGAFIANYVGSDALAATNIIYPLNNLVIGIGIMFATGASAKVATLLGEGKKKTADERFTLSIVVSFVIAVLYTAVCILFFKPFLYMLGADETTYRYCFIYGGIIVLGGPLEVLKEMLVSYMRVDGRPRLSLAAIISGGVINIIFDYIFIKIFGWGVAGAAIATVMGFTLGSILGLIYFKSRHAGLKFTKFKIDMHFILQIMANGSSEMVNQVSVGITTFLFNVIAIRYFGADGVAAVTVVMYSQFIFIAVYLGLSMGAAPYISYHHGAQKHETNKMLLRYSWIFISVTGVLLFVTAFFYPQVTVTLFAKEGTQVYDLAVYGMHLFSYSVLFSGFNIYISGLFTALENGLLSSIVAMCRSFLFLTAALLILPRIFGFDGVWLSIPAAEALTIVVCAVLWTRTRKRYRL